MAGETNYLSVAYVCAMWKESTILALFDSANTTALASDAGFLETCYAASAVISRAVTSAGYVAPTDGTATTPTQKFINLATFGEFVWICHSKPSKRLPLPEGWENDSWMIARKEILSGDTELDLPMISDGSGHGAIISSLETDHPTIFHRSNFE